MRILPSQENELADKIEATDLFDAAHFRLDYRQLTPSSTDETAVMQVARNPRMFFRIGVHDGAYYVLRSPGDVASEEKARIIMWAHLMQYFAHWLRLVHREEAAERRPSTNSEPEPPWVEAELPAAYSDIIEQLTTLDEAERRMRRMAGLLWQTGEPLNRLVKDVFRQLGFAAEITKPGATYDVLVTIPAGGRLLIEVTGIEGQVTKGSKKIAQVLSAMQIEVQPGDRVCLAVNTHRTMPLASRASLEPLTPEALALLKSLNAVVFLTSDLYTVFKGSSDDPTSARDRVARLHSAPSGLFGLAQ